MNRKTRRFLALWSQSNWNVTFGIIQGDWPNQRYSGSFLSSDPRKKRRRNSVTQVRLTASSALDLHLMWTTRGNVWTISTPFPHKVTKLNFFQHHHDDHHHEPGMPYDFEYKVKDDYYGTDYSRNEVSQAYQKKPTKINTQIPGLWRRRDPWRIPRPASGRTSPDRQIHRRLEERLQRRRFVPRWADLPRG